MAALVALLSALGRAIKRDLGSFLSVRLNNFFLFAALLIYSSLVSGMKPVASIPFLALLGFLLLFPLSSDPLNKVPATRLALWPLTRQQRLGLRLASLALSPVAWLAAIILLATASPLTAVLFLALVLGIGGLSALGIQLAKCVPPFNLQYYVPQLPGRLGGLVRNNVRQMICVLDLYVAILLSIAGWAYRWSGLNPHADASALPILALLVALAWSTYAQCLFGLDSASGLTRYRLLPLRGWQILLAKDVAFLGILLVLVLPLSLRAGLTFGLAAVAIGRYPSLALHLPQQRWRFASGDLRFGVPQIVAGTGLGFAESQNGPWFLMIAALAYVISLYYGGRYWDRVRQRSR